MIRSFILPISALLLMASPARGEEAGALLEHFDGRWTSDGPAFGGEATSAMTWAPALKDRFYRLDYSVAVTREDGASFTFEGVAHYQLGDGETLLAYWADNSGDLHPIRAERDGDALIAHWGIEGAKQGRTRYELLPSGEIEVTDWIMTKDGWRQFNQNRFMKQASE